MYIAGYAVECLIKAKLMEMFGKKNLEELEAELKRRNLIPRDSSLFDHRIELYLRASGRLDALRENTPVWRSFSAANQWVPSWRYNPDLSSQPDAEGFLAAVDSLLEWISKNI
jgi:hypothetical protein